MRTLAVVVVLLLGAITFAGAADKTVSDDEIYDRVRLKLNSDTEVKGGHIDVKVTNGAVELTGTVGQEKVRVKAEKLTRKIKGVRSVVNNLKVSTTSLPEP